MNHILTALLVLLAAPAFAQTAIPLTEPEPLPFTISSTDLREGEPIPDMHMAGTNGCDGMNLSPSLSWEYPPEGTQSFAVTMFDEQGNGGNGALHWALLNIPADTKMILRALDTPPNPLPEGAVYIPNNWGHAAYDGPCPPVGDTPHNYFFTVYALPNAVTEYRLSAIGWPTLDWLTHRALAKATIRVTAERLP